MRALRMQLADERGALAGAALSTLGLPCVVGLDLSASNIGKQASKAARARARVLGRLRLQAPARCGGLLALPVPPPPTAQRPAFPSPAAQTTAPTACPRW